MSYGAEVEHREIDVSNKEVTNRWSRYIGAMGIEAVVRQAAASVLLVGLNPLGIEVAKNIVLSGVKRFSVLDSKIVDPNDLCGQFFLSEMDVGRTRAEASIRKLQELNH